MPLPDPGVARASFLDFLNGEGHEIDPEREDWLIAMGLQ